MIYATTPFKSEGQKFIGNMTKNIGEFMLEYLFGTTIIEKILFYILVNKKCYPSQLKKTFQMPLYSFQRAFDKLEKGGILISQREGKTIIYQFNPYYVFLKELEIFLQKAYQFLPEDVRDKYYEPITRKRPRRKGKPL